MNVELIAATQIQPAAHKYLAPQELSTDSEYLIEFAGRACYQSWDRPNPETRATRDYVRKNILGKDHGSVLEHASATFYVTGVSRSLTHELIRHRHLSFSELSQRYVDIGSAEFVVPPAVRDNVGRSVLGDYWSQRDTFWAARADYTDLVRWLTHSVKLPRKRAREAARAFMPNATETRIVVTGNYRAWRHVIAMRGSEQADAEIREFAIKVLELLYEQAPSVFGDFSIVELPNGRRVVE